MEEGRNKELDMLALRVRLMEMLHQIDIICKNYNIPYWLSSGNLLGAVRNGQFVPWDDDIDIEMEYKDYKRFLKVALHELPSDLILHSHHNDKAYYLGFAKVRDLRSKIITHDAKDKIMLYHGAFIDIMPVEKAHPVLAWWSGKMFSFLLWKTAGKGMEVYPLYKAYLSCTYFVVFHMVAPLCRFLGIFLPNKSYYIIYGSNFLRSRRYEDIFPLSTIRFEGMELPAPHRVDSFLTSLYGKDYLKLPPVNQRVNHIAQINFLDSNSHS